MEGQAPLTACQKTPFCGCSTCACRPYGMGLRRTNRELAKEMDTATCAATGWNSKYYGSNSMHGEIASACVSNDGLFDSTARKVVYKNSNPPPFDNSLDWWKKRERAPTCRSGDGQNYEKMQRKHDLLRTECCESEKRASSVLQVARCADRHQDQAREQHTARRGVRGASQHRHGAVPEALQWVGGGKRPAQEKCVQQDHGKHHGGAALVGVPYTRITKVTNLLFYCTVAKSSVI